jgi:hypothetical protein
LADLVVFVALVGLIGAAGIVLGMLAARRLGAWDDRRAGAAEAARAPGATGTTTADDPGEDGGETVD